MKRLFMLMTALIMAWPGALAAEPTALEAFESLLAQPSILEDAAVCAEVCLDEVMAGLYESDPQTSDGTEALASRLEALCRVTNRDLAAYASAHQMKMAQVRNAWYKALAGAYRAQLKAYPDPEGPEGDARRLISTFLNDGHEEEKAVIRSQMDPRASARIAGQSGLPEAFVSFLIMDQSWDDDSWENDEDWMPGAGWGSDGSAGFDDVIIGARDSASSTVIADMQEILIANGYLKGKADGIFGPRTQAALLEFQLANGQQATGVYDVATYDLMRSADLVARWDYDVDFRDTSDFASADTTKDDGSGKEPDKGEGVTVTREHKDTPDTPDTLDTPDTPERKKTSASPKKTGKPDSTDSED